MEKATLYHLVKDTVFTFAKNPLFWIKTKSSTFYSAISYENWYSDLKRFSSYLIYKLDLAHGDRVAVLCNNHYESSVISLGINCLGAVNVPIPNDISQEDFIYILEHSQAEILIIEKLSTIERMYPLLVSKTKIKNVILVTESPSYKETSAFEKHEREIKIHSFLNTLTIGEEFLIQYKEDEILKRAGKISPDDLATILYSAVLETKPQDKIGNYIGTSLTHRNLCWSLSKIPEILSDSNYSTTSDTSVLCTIIDENDRAILVLPPSNIVVRLWGLTLFSAGASMISSRLEFLWDDFAAIKPTVFLAVPSLWSFLRKNIISRIDAKNYLKDEKTKLFYFASKIDGLHEDIRLLKNKKYKDNLKKNIHKINLLFLRIFIRISLFIAKKLVKNSTRLKLLGGKLRIGISVDGFISNQTAKFFHLLDLPVINIHGTNETSGIGIWSQLNYKDNNASKEFEIIGCDGIELKLKDDLGDIISKPRKRGTLYQKGPHIMTAYYNAQAKTKKVLRDDWFCTNDIFEWSNDDAKGTVVKDSPDKENHLKNLPVKKKLSFIANAKDIITLSNGQKVYPRPIEEKLLESKYIEQVLIISKNKNVIGALLYPNQNNLKTYFKRYYKYTNLEFQNKFEEWLKSDDMNNFYLNILKEKISVANGFKYFEKVTDLFILPQKVNLGHELLMLASKIETNDIISRYDDEIIKAFKSK